MSDQAHAKDLELYRVVSLERKNGEHIAGTEEVLYEGNNKILALATLDMFDYYDEQLKAAILSKYIPEKNSWETVEERWS